ncbi:CGNR zinc finger domain-containing protein [Microbacterium sp.]|uniref:CGNR zinc finger domain-containing protein n=1 Tax=Microbacterium sp. TaxID=51671 RepID=UPI0035C6E72D
MLLIRVLLRDVDRTLTLRLRGRRGWSFRGGIVNGPDRACLYLDSSRENNRRWCTTNICGNKNKKNRMPTRPGTPPWPHPVR